MIEILLDNIIKTELIENSIIKPIDKIGVVEGYDLLVPLSDVGSERLIKMIDFSKEVYDLDSFPSHELMPSEVKDGEIVVFAVNGKHVVPIKIDLDDDIMVFTGQPGENQILVNKIVDKVIGLDL